MRSFTTFLFFVLFTIPVTLWSCAQQAGDTGFPWDTGGYGFEADEKTISSSNVEKLIAAGRAELGKTKTSCKEWVRSIVTSALGSSYTIPSTAGNQYSWASSSVVTNKAQWIGSYANGRLSISSLAANTTYTASGKTYSADVSIPNSDTQQMVIYAAGDASTSVTATLTYGSTTATVTSTGGTGGTLSSTFAGSKNTWKLSVKNTHATKSASSIVVVVLSYSRFVSDWETARRGDIMQMYGGTSSSNRATGGPHTTFVQTDYNTNGSSSTGGNCSGAATGSTNTSGCNWLDSNWATVPDYVVRSHNISMSDMMKMMAHSANYGFTVYRIN